MAEANVQAEGGRSTSTKKIVLIVLAVVGVGFLLLVGLVVGLVFFVFNLVQSSEPYERSFEAVRTHEPLIEVIGEPIEAGWMTNGSYDSRPNGSTLEATYSVEGPDGSATVWVDAIERGGEWQYRTLEVQPEGGQRMNLLPLEASTE